MNIRSIIYFVILISAVKINANFNDIQVTEITQDIVQDIVIEHETIKLPWSDCTEIHKLFERKFSFSEKQVKKENKIYEGYRKFYTHIKTTGLAPWSVHMHLSIPPKVRVSDVVRTIKSITGRFLKKKFEYIRKAYWGIDGIWSDGYFVSTVGINEHIIKRYIEHQGQEDMGQAQLLYSTFRST